MGERIENGGGKIVDCHGRLSNKSTILTMN